MKKIIRNQNLEFLPERAIHWLEKNALILSDVHIGKANFFRAEGIPISNQIVLTDIEKLNFLIDRYNPDDIYILGDLFHNHRNKEWDLFCEFRESVSEINFHLIIGNHDIFPMQYYLAANIIVYESQLEIKPFTFIHDEIPNPPNDCFQFSGHIHPGITINIGVRQNVTLPCYHIKVGKILLPAFGRFTGLVKIVPSKGDCVLAIAEGKVLRVF
ncbi:MAG: ligase-associated DNA damage response endonuclease PdeM [Bacteroidota bacterium]|nr:ligase-associated DNA damage response endonuclease PdeM [Bacteroidota bacterium]